MLGCAKVKLADEFIGMAVCDVESACLDYVLRGTCNCKITQIFKLICDIFCLNDISNDVKYKLKTSYLQTII